MDLLPAILKASAGVTIKALRKNGGDIRITSPQLDRDRDRVIPAGGRLDNYRRNPVVQWGHQYMEPWQTIGRTTDLVVSADGIDAAFELREPASDTDPQHIVLQLWGEGYINAASIGFQPLAASPNDMTGLDFTEWDLLEWSLVPIPANAGALRLALDRHPLAAKSFGAMVAKRGRTLSAKNEGRIREIAAIAQAMLDEMDDDEDEKPRAASIVSLSAESIAHLADAMRSIVPPPTATITAPTEPTITAPDAGALLTALRQLQRVTNR